MNERPDALKVLHCRVSVHAYPLAALIVAFAAMTACLSAATITEDFNTDPADRGWLIFGDTNLFKWNAANQNLNVTWDSSLTNSYFYLPLGTILNRQDDFSFALDLKLTDIAAGVDPSKPSTFQLSFGFLNLVDATRTNFFRGNGARSPNLVEFDFFPDTGFAPTVWPSAWSTNSSLNYNGSGDYTILDLPVGALMRVVMAYSADDQTLRTSIATNGVSIGIVQDVKLTPTFTDFRVGGFAFESYSEAGQNPLYVGSILAHGVADNILITVPPPPVQNLTGKFVNTQWQVTFFSRTNWVYTLQRTAGLQSWADVSPKLGGNGASLVLADANPGPESAFYRVRAERP
jgi:hypothetical protein